MVADIGRKLACQLSDEETSDSVYVEPAMVNDFAYCNLDSSVRTELESLGSRVHSELVLVQTGVEIRYEQWERPLRWGRDH